MEVFIVFIISRHAYAAFADRVGKVDGVGGAGQRRVGRGLDVVPRLAERSHEQHRGEVVVEVQSHSKPRRAPSWGERALYLPVELPCSSMAPAALMRASSLR